MGNWDIAKNFWEVYLWKYIGDQDRAITKHLKSSILMDLSCSYLWINENII